MSKELLRVFSGFSSATEHTLHQEGSSQYSKIIKWLLVFRRFRSVVAERRPDFIITHLDGSLLVVALSFWQKKWRHIHVFHGPPVRFLGLRGIAYRALQRLALLRCDAFSFVSREQMQEHKLAYRFGSAQICEVITNPFIRSQFGLAEEDRDAIAVARASGRAVFILPGRLSVQKNQRFALRVMAQRKAAGKSDVLLFAGAGDAQERTLLLDAALQAGLDVGFDISRAHEVDIVFLGHRRDVQELMRAADLVILPSLHEGFPLALVEAVCLGCNVISSECRTGPREIYEVIKDQFSAAGRSENIPLRLMPFGFDANDVTKWCEEIARFSANRVALSENELKVINCNFSRSQYASRWMALLSLLQTR